MPGIYLIYHVGLRTKDGVGPAGTVTATGPVQIEAGMELCREGSALALPPQESRDVQGRGRLELSAGPDVIRHRDR